MDANEYRDWANRIEAKIERLYAHDEAAADDCRSVLDSVDFVVGDDEVLRELEANVNLILEAYEVIEPDTSPTKADIIKAELEGILGSMHDNFRDLRGDELFGDAEVADEAVLAFLVQAVVNRWEDIKPYCS